MRASEQSIPNQANSTHSNSQYLSNIGIWFSFPQSQWFLSRSIPNNFINGIDKWFFDKNKFTQSFVNANFTNKNFIKEKTAEANKIELVFTKDPTLLEQYYKLREDTYRTELGFEKYDGSENDFDRRGEIMIATQNNNVVAGARLDLSSANKNMYNDYPEHGFVYRDIIKKFDPTFSDDDIYSEICGLVLGKFVKNSYFFPRFFNSLVKQASSNNCRYVVGIAYPVLCRLYNMMFKHLGYNFKIFYDIRHPFNSNKHGNKLKLVFCPIVIKLY